MLKKMEKAGLICRRRSQEDERVVVISITGRGEEFQEKAAQVPVKMAGCVTLENDGIASFPDAPTERGIKHLQELIAAKNNGFEAYILFVIQMKGIHTFTPNDETHKAFGDTLRQAAESGVKILAYDCAVTPDEMKIYKPIKILL